MHYAEFAEDEVSDRPGCHSDKCLLLRIFMLSLLQSIKLRDAIKEYETNKWKVIGQKVGKPAKVCSHCDSPTPWYTN